MRQMSTGTKNPLSNGNINLASVLLRSEVGIGLLQALSWKSGARQKME
jgi:hypothetical protein